MHRLLDWFRSSEPEMLPLDSEELSSHIVVTGDSGSGKTALIESFLYRIAVNSRRQDTYENKVQLEVIDSNDRSHFIPNNNVFDELKNTVWYERRSYTIVRRIQELNQTITHQHLIRIDDAPGDALVYLSQLPTVMPKPPQALLETIMQIYQEADAIVVAIPDGGESTSNTNYTNLLKYLFDVCKQSCCFAIVITQNDASRVNDPEEHIQIFYDLKANENIINMLKFSKHQYKLFSSSACGYLSNGDRNLDKGLTSENPVKWGLLRKVQWEPSGVVDPFYWLFNQLLLLSGGKNDHCYQFDDAGSDG